MLKFKDKRKFYNSCDVLPLWNFFKINDGQKQNLKYLIAINDRLDYNDLLIEGEELLLAEELWDKVFEEYNGLEKNFGVANFINDRTKILYFYGIYLQEQAVLRSLLYKTNPGYIRFLRGRGYEISNRSQMDYWNSLLNGLKRVENHISYIEILKNKLKDVSSSGKKEGNPFDSIMAWIASNDIKVDENITVSRYIKIKEIIQQRLKAKQKQMANG